MGRIAIKLDGETLILRYHLAEGCRMDKWWLPEPGEWAALKMAHQQFQRPCVSDDKNSLALMP